MKPATETDNDDEIVPSPLKLSSRGELRVSRILLPELIKEGCPPMISVIPHGGGKPTHYPCSPDIYQRAQEENLHAEISCDWLLLYSDEVVTGLRPIARDAEAPGARAEAPRSRTKSATAPSNLLVVRRTLAGEVSVDYAPGGASAPLQSEVLSLLRSTPGARTGVVLGGRFKIERSTQHEDYDLLEIDPERR